MSEPVKFDANKEALKEWSKAAPKLYERLTAISLEWPTLCAQWCLQENEQNEALVSTYTLRQEPEFLRRLEINSKLGHPDYIKQQWMIPGSDKLDAGEGDFDSYALLFLAQSPLKPEIIAACSDDGKLLLFDQKVAEKPVAEFENGAGKSGAGLAWEPKAAHCLAVGSIDGEIALWEIDYDNFEKSKKTASFNSDVPVNEVTWTHPNRIIVSLESGEVLVLNPPVSAGQSTLQLESRLKVSKHAINSASLSPFSQNLLAAGDDSGTLVLYDVRHPDPAAGQLYSISQHSAKVTHVRWSPHIDGVLATGGFDGLVVLYDLRKIGLTSTQDDGEIVEVLFKHLGHLDGDQLTALDFHPRVPMQLLSSDEKCKLMVWQVRKELYEERRRQRPN